MGLLEMELTMADLQALEAAVSALAEQVGANVKSASVKVEELKQMCEASIAAPKGTSRRGIALGGLHAV